MLALGGAAVAAVAAWVRWRPFLVEVAGDSMEPALRAGDRRLAVRVRPAGFRMGMVVVARPPSRPGLEVVKRIAAGPGELAPNGRDLGPDEWFLLGDRQERSTDSRHFGPVPAAAIVGRVLGVAATGGGPESVSSDSHERPQRSEGVDGGQPG